MLQKKILYFGQECLLVCDGKCHKAWGINSRPKEYLSDNEDDYEWLADEELGIAPIDPGTYEGGHAKPTSDFERLNKWCARECERSNILDLGEIDYLPCFKKRFKNYDPNKENEKGEKVSYLESLEVR